MNTFEKVYFNDVFVHFILVFNEVILFKTWAIKRGAAKIMASLAVGNAW